jgi:hypothetical protein
MVKQCDIHNRKIILFLLYFFTLPIQITAQKVTKHSFFLKNYDINARLQPLLTDLQKQIQKYDFRNEFIINYGLPLWQFTEKIKKSRAAYVYIVPIAKKNALTSFFIASQNKGKFSYEIHEKKALKNYNPEYSQYMIGQYDIERILSALEYKCFKKLRKKLLLLRPESIAKIIRKTGSANFGFENLKGIIKTPCFKAKTNNTCFIEDVISTFEISGNQGAKKNNVVAIFVL